MGTSLRKTAKLIRFVIDSLSCSQLNDNAGMPTGTDFPYFVRKICANTEIRFMPFRVRITKKKKKKKKRLQKEIMTCADKLIGGNSNITLYYFHGRANVVNLMWLAYVKSIRILLSRWPIKMYFTELSDRCKADIWRHAGCNFCKQEWYYLLRYGTGVIIMASKPTKTVRHQKFLTEYTAKWDFIVPSVKGETYARCNSCNSDFSIKSSGAYDIKIHMNQQSINLVRKQERVTTLSQVSLLQRKTISALFVLKPYGLNS